MANITWKGGNGNWADPSQWIGGVVPGVGDTAILGGSAHGVMTLSGAMSVGALTISDSVAGLTVASGGLTDTIGGDLTNGGFVEFDRATGAMGGSLAIGGTLTNTHYFAIGSASLASDATVTARHLVNKGDLLLAGGATGQATLDVTGQAVPATLGNGTSIALSGNALLEFASGGITTLAGGSMLWLDGTEARVAVAADTSTSSALVSLATINGQLELADGASVATHDLANNYIVELDTGAHLAVTGNLDNSGGIDIDDMESGGGGSSLSVSGTLTNSGDLGIGRDDMATATTVTIGHLVNTTGGLFVTGNATDHVQATLNVLDAAPTTLAKGAELFVSGDALLEFASGSLTTIAKGAELDVRDGGRIANASDTTTNSALSGLSSNAGQLTLIDSTVTTAAGVDFANTGDVSLFDSTLTIGGALTAFGSLELNGANIEVQGGAAPGTLAAGSDLDLNGSNIDFAGGAITRIASGATLILLDSSIGNGGGANSALATLSRNSGTFTLVGQLSTNAGIDFISSGFLGVSSGGMLNLGGDFTNSGKVDVYFGSHLAVAGDVSNSSQFVVEGGFHSISDAHVAGSFTNTGTLNLHDQGSLSIGGALHNNGTATFDAVLHQAGQASFNIGGAFTNSGSFTAGNAGMHRSDVLNAASLANSGSLTLEGTSATVVADLRVHGNALNSGSIAIGAFAEIDRMHIFTQSAGETEVDGMLVAKKTVLSGGTMDGTGTIGGNLDQSGGGIAGGSGGASGTLHILGKFAQMSGGTLAAHLDAAGSGSANDLDVGAMIALKGGTLALDIANADSLSVGETFTVLTFGAGMLSGKFGAITDGAITGSGDSIDLGNGLSLDAVYDNADGRVQLVVAETPAHAVSLEVGADGAAVYHHGDIILAHPASATVDSGF